jgi:hypothetical protein
VQPYIKPIHYKSESVVHTDITSQYTEICHQYSSGGAVCPLPGVLPIFNLWTQNLVRIDSLQDVFSMVPTGTHLRLDGAVWWKM